MHSTYDVWLYKVRVRGESLFDDTSFFKQSWPKGKLGP